jgi:hypothetical protein
MTPELIFSGAATDRVHRARRAFLVMLYLRVLNSLAAAMVPIRRSA